MVWYNGRASSPVGRVTKGVATWRTAAAGPAVVYLRLDTGVQLLDGALLKAAWPWPRQCTVHLLGEKFGLPRCLRGQHDGNGYFVEMFAQGRGVASRHRCSGRRCPTQGTSTQVPRRRAEVSVADYKWQPINAAGVAEEHLALVMDAGCAPAAARPQCAGLKQGLRSCMSSACFPTDEGTHLSCTTCTCSRMKCCQKQSAHSLRFPPVQHHDEDLNKSAASVPYHHPKQR